jgi:hypothetical protein
VIKISRVENILKLMRLSKMVVAMTMKVVLVVMMKVMVVIMMKVMAAIMTKVVLAMTMKVVTATVVVMLGVVTAAAAMVTMKKWKAAKTVTWARMTKDMSLLRTVVKSMLVETPDAAPVAEWWMHES